VIPTPQTASTSVS